MAIDPWQEIPYKFKDLFYFTTLLTTQEYDLQKCAILLLTLTYIISITYM